jgi:threonyl-tRNA synthetase
VAVLPVSDKFAEYAAGVTAKLKAAGLRADFDESADKIGAKIRRATMSKIPYMVVIGAKEMEAGTVAVRERTKGDLGEMSAEKFVEAIIRERDSKGGQPVTV